MFKLDFKKAEEPDIKLPTSVGSLKKQESSRKMSTSASLITKAFDCVDHNKLENSERDGNSRPPDLEPIIQNEVNQKEKHQYSILTHIYGI